MPAAKTVLAGIHGELVPAPGVQRSEDARNLTSLRARRRSPGDLEQPPGNRRRKFLNFRSKRPRSAGGSQKKMWRCVMSGEAKSVPEERLEEGLGSLRGCLVEGDAEQRRGERHVRRRALAISILLQSAVLATLILVPLFGKAERISLTIVTPVVPCGPPSNHPRGNARTTTSRRSIRDLRFTFHPPTNSVNQHPVEADDPIGPLVEFDPNENFRDYGPGCPGCVDIGGKTTGLHPPQQPIEPPRGPRVV